MVDATDHATVVFGNIVKDKMKARLKFEKFAQTKENQLLTER